MSRQRFLTFPLPEKESIGALKCKKNNSKNVRIYGSIENKIYSAIWVNPKNVFEHYPNPKNNLLGPKKPKTTPKLSQNTKSKLKVS